MKKRLAILAVLLISMLSLSITAFADQYVNGYYRSDGTYVNGYYRTDPNDTTEDNYSHQGNVNPYTGHRGCHK
jgi:hypothetical protein